MKVQKIEKYEKIKTDDVYILGMETTKTIPKNHNKK